MAIKTKNNDMAIVIISIIGINFNLFLAIETSQNHFISYFKKKSISLFGENFATFL
jgi:hypothetical protein